MKLVHRVAAAALIAGGLAGCKNMGLQDLRTHEQAMYSELTPLLAQVSEIQPPRPLWVVQLGGQNWISTPDVYQMPESLLEPVGGLAGGVRFYRLAWDDAPYDRVFASRPQGYVA